MKHEEVEALLDFNAEMYGKASYQASRRYLDWLYAQNPAGRGLGDCLIALEQDSIVGCIHRMRLPCITEQGEATLASLQNHVVSPKLRAGAGIMLLQRAVKGERFAFSPGVSGRLQEAYRRLGYEELPSYWLMRMLRPLKAVAERVARLASRGRWPSARLRLTAPATPFRALSVTLAPSTLQLQRLADSLTAQARKHEGSYVAWNTALLGWRYFSPNGPRHLLVEKQANQAWAVLSYGVKSGFNVVRLLEYDDADDPTFMSDVMRTARRIGASVALAYTTSSQVRDRLVRSGWRPRGQPPASFATGAGKLSLSAGATDVGFESLLTEEAS